MPDAFGSRRICYINFAGHLLNAYNPNVLHPGLPHRWDDDDWQSFIDMIAGFGFNVFEFWFLPSFFCREGLASQTGREFLRQMAGVVEHAHRRHVKVEAICSLATVGSDWVTLCPNIESDWQELRHLWRAWTERLPGLDIVGIFPGDPGACSRNGCTAETYIDRAADVADVVKDTLPDTETELHTWGPPFFGWGLIETPPDSRGEFVPAHQASAWTFSAERTERSMTHLLRRLPDFPKPTSVAINLGFNPDGNPDSPEDARHWARRIAATHPIQTWDFSLTEGENAIMPHFRFERLFQRRREEREAAPYRGGICFSMTPWLNQLSLYVSAQSFLQPGQTPTTLARQFYGELFGDDAARIVEALPLFEIVKDWGAYSLPALSREEYHRRMTDLSEVLESVEARYSKDLPVAPSPDFHRRALLFYANLFADLSSPAPDYDALHARYWNHVYAIYDRLPQHVDPRPRNATDHLIRTFQELA